MATGSRLTGARAVAARVTRDLAVQWQPLCDEFGESAVRSARRQKLIECVLPGIHVAVGRGNELKVRARALTIAAAPEGRVTGLAAAYLWGVIDEPPDRVTVQVPRHWHGKVPTWARLLRVPHDGQRFRVGVTPLVSAADAVIQCWREARPDVAAATVIAAVERQVASASDLFEALARRKQMPRRALLAELIGRCGNTVTSYLEYVAWRDVFPPGLFPELQWQVETMPNGRRRVMDAFDPEAMIDLEFDGGSTHGGVEGFERDRERDADMRSCGIEPLHFTYRDLTRRPEWCRKVYVELRARRLRERAWGEGRTAVTTRLR